MTTEHLLQYAAEEGFSAAIVDTNEITFDSAFRPYCAENLCGQYGANYSCPPVCGTPEEMRERISVHKKALILQTLWDISDFSDHEAIRHAKSSHNTASLRLMQRLRDAGCPVCFMVGASSCSLCAPCSITQNLPCRFPELRYSCMSAYCIYVRKLAEQCHMLYDCNKGQLSFFGMLILD